MARFATIATPAGRPILANLHINGAHKDDLPLLMGDRAANGNAFVGETLVRYPRRLTKMCRRLRGSFHITSGTARAWLNGNAHMEIWYGFRAR